MVTILEKKNFLFYFILILGQQVSSNFLFFSCRTRIQTREAALTPIFFFFFFLFFCVDVVNNNKIINEKKEDSFEDLQKMFVEMLDGDGGDGGFNFNLGGGGEKRRRTGVSDSQGNASSKRGAHRVNMSTFSSSHEPFML
eukprot:TRINITY_DN5599_c1_g3_i2.p1 TRINITY_DN5599_c1_g3~~TRINITY_DN5599_c1_g3_i2.p1  ORF type:complete len:140 (-),score=12.39 TRINITY_DN5599_c1_g3_i2:202-621(-)